MVRTTLTVLLILATLTCAATAKKPDQSAFQPLAIPAYTGAWTVKSSDGNVPSISMGKTGGPRLEFDKPAKPVVYTLKLKKPVPMPTGTRRVGIWCCSAGNFWGDYMPIKFLLRDATGVNYSYTILGPRPTPGVWSYIECPRLRGGELGRLDETMILVEGGLQHHLPVDPVSFVGLQVDVRPDGPDKQVLEFGQAFADGVKRESSKFYWYCDLGEKYFFGDVPFASVPFVTSGDLLNQPGDYKVCWTARKSQFGRTVAQGEWRIPRYDAEVASRFERHVMPIFAKGQYWLQFKITDNGKPVRTVDARLKIVRGTDAQPATLNPEMRPVGGSMILNPQRDENVYSPGELAKCTIRVWQQAAGHELTLKLRRNSYPSGTIVAEETYSVKFSADSGNGQSSDQPYTDIDIPLELTAAAPMQQLEFKLFDGSTEIDRISEWVGLKSNPDSSPWTNRDKVLRWGDILENGNHLLSCAEWDGRYKELRNPKKFEEWVQDVKKQNVNTIELFPSITEIEPMPGVFWWDELDKRVDLVAKNGLRVMINLDCTAVPSWMPEESQADEEGMVSGLWGNGVSVLKSPSSSELWKYYGEYLTHIALRYRNNPSVVAYTSLSIYFDHVWADHPWLGRYVDYSDSARDAFRNYLRDICGFSLADLSTRWNRKIASWNDVELPRTDLFLGMATIDRPDPRPEWRDFLDFRLWAQKSFFTVLVAGTVRKYDDLRPIGFHGLWDDDYYRRNHIFQCAGGSEGSIDSFRSPNKFPVRAESIAVSWYTPCYTAMSVTNRMATGNTNLQHFWMPWWRWDSCQRDDRMTATHALAGWNQLLQGDLGKAKPVHAADVGPKPVLGLMHSRASILHGVRSFHWFRLDDYKLLLERGCTAPKKMIEEDVTSEDLSKLPCVVVDRTARILPKDTIDRLVTYVKNGGKLLFAPTSGAYTLDPADGEHVLGRALGIATPKSKWQMAAENRQSGEYAPYYPWEITGKGTPGEQSLGEPGETASATVSDSSVFPITRKLVFRVGPYTMYNRDTWGDWAHMIPYFVYGRYKEAGIDGGTVVADWSDGGPAATLHNVGKGQVLSLWGTPDWFNWKEALNDVAKWASPNGPTVESAPQPYVVSPDGFNGYILVKDDVRWAVIRNESMGWTAFYYDVDKQKDAKRMAGSIKVNDLTAPTYRVQDITPLLSQGFDKTLTKEQLAGQGITVDLIPGETRIFRLDPVK